MVIACAWSRYRLHRAFSGAFQGMLSYSPGISGADELLAGRYFPTLLVVLLAVFNDGAMIALSKDRVRASALPDAWNLRNIFISGEARAALQPWEQGVSLMTACQRGQIQYRRRRERRNSAFHPHSDEEPWQGSKPDPWVRGLIGLSRSRLFWDWEGIKGDTWGRTCTLHAAVSALPGANQDWSVQGNWESQPECLVPTGLTPGFSRTRVCLLMSSGFRALGSGLRLQGLSAACASWPTK